MYSEWPRIDTLYNLITGKERRMGIFSPVEYRFRITRGVRKDALYCFTDFFKNAILRPRIFHVEYTRVWQG